MKKKRIGILALLDRFCESGLEDSRRRVRIGGREGFFGPKALTGARGHSELVPDKSLNTLTRERPGICLLRSNYMAVRS